MNKQIYVFAGPNGSGKSTIIKDFLGKCLCPSEYICPDNYVSAEKKDDVGAYIVAMQQAETIRNDLVTLGRSFTFETVLSTTGKLDFVKQAKELGYFISVTYVTTVDYNINIKRVEERVRRGGHGVPTDKLIARYHKSLALMAAAIEISDSAKVYDNSARPVLVFAKDGDEQLLLNREQRNSYFDEYFKGFVIVSDLTCTQTEEFYK